MATEKKKNGKIPPMPDFETIRIPQYRRPTKAQKEERLRTEQEYQERETVAQTERLKRMMDTINDHPLMKMIFDLKQQDPVEKYTMLALPAVIQAYPDKIEFDQVNIAHEIGEHMAAKFAK